jgi:hypothetical protein
MAKDANGLGIVGASLTAPGFVAPTLSTSGRSPSERTFKGGRRHAPIAVWSAAPAGRRGELRDVRLIVGGRIGIGLRPSTVLQESDAAETRLVVALLLGTRVGRAMVALTIGGLTVVGLTIAALTIAALTIAALTIAALTIAALTIAALTIAALPIAALTIVELAIVGLAIIGLTIIGLAIILAIAPLAVGLLGLTGLALLLRVALLALLAAAVTPALVVALGNAAHGLDQAEVVIRILPIGLGHDPVAGRPRFSRQRLVFVEYLVGVATHTHIGTAAIENLVSIRWAVRIVIVLLLVMIGVAATAATAIAATTRPLPIIWSHKT